MGRLGKAAYVKSSAQGHVREVVCARSVTSEISEWRCSNDRLPRACKGVTEP